MTVSEIVIYECDNTSCQLRFPVYENARKPKRCPACRASMHVVITTMTMQTGEAKRPVTISEWNIVVLLDNIRSAWNVGAILRTADGAGIRKVYCCGITPTPDNSKVSKTALGAELIVPWEKNNNGVKLANHLKLEGYSLWVLEDVPGAIPLYSVKFEKENVPIVLVVGNENCGVDPGIIERSEKVISIPMFGKKQSYNVAVAFGIAISFLLYRHSVSHGSFKILPRI